MTFKHKLSRRLALLKDRTMVVSTALLAVATIVGCERPLTFTDPGTGTSSRLVLSPKILTLRQNQVADFTAVGLAATGDTATVAVSWSVTSGSITDTSTSNGKHYGRYKAGSDTGKVKVTATGNPGGSDTAVVTVTPVPVASVSVSPASVSAQVGQTVQLSATTKDSAGAVLTGRAVSWSSSNPSAASVSGSGLVTGLAAGSATLTATSEGQSGTAAIAVTTVPVASVAVTPASAGIQVGQTAQLTATPKDGSGNALSGRIVTWASSNGSVATVNASGLATAVAAGSAMITATSEGQSGTSSITVTNVPVASVALTPASATIQVGQTQQLAATLKDASGNTLSGRAVSWSSSSPSVATVSGSGLVTGLATGSAAVTATSEGQSGTSSITVTTVPVASVAVTPASATIQVGQTQQLAATLKDASGNTLSGRAVSWSSSNPSVTTVSGSGLVTGSTVGSATLTATSEGQSGTAAIAVTTVPVASVAVTPASATIQVGQTQQLAATLKDASGNTLSGRAVSWSSSSPSVATVSSSGLVTGIAVGSAVITATSEGQSGTAAIAVTTIPVASVAVTPASAGIQIGQTVQLTATPKDGSGSPLSGRTVTWASSNGLVATVSGSGLVTAAAAGSAIITATSEGQSGTSSITVTTVPVASVAVTPASATIQVGQTQQLAATLKDASGNTLSGRAVSWSSSNSSVASVSSSGLVTGLAAGSAVITATSEGKSGTATLTVVAPPPPPGAPGAVTDLVVAGATDTSVALSFTEVSDGTGQPASYDVRFAVAPISWGSATAVARGTCATPLAGSAIGAKRTCTVLGLSASTTFGFQLIAFRGTLNVDAVFGGLSNVATGTTAAGAPKPVASVTVSPATVSVGVGGTQQFTATLRDANGNVLSGRTVTWSSSSPAIATVSSTGLTSALLAGTTTVTATSEGQSGSAGLTVSALPPPPPSGTWANEPTGFTQYSDQPWSTLGSWALNDNVSGNASLVTLSGLPLSPSGALQYLFPTGMTGGGGGTGPGRADYYYPTGQQPTETYVGLWIKLGSPFQPHSSGVQKFLYLTDNNGAVFSALWFELYGGQAPLHLSLVNQFTGCPSIRIEPNATMTPINPGEWHKYEIYFKLASTGNASDGVVKVWVDGVLNVSLSNVCSLGRDSARLGRVALSAIWGGVGETKTENDYLWYDHTYVSGH